MNENTATFRPPRGAALRATKKEAATAHAAAAEIRGLNAPFEQGVFDPPHPPPSIGKCNCRRGDCRSADAKKRIIEYLEFAAGCESDLVVAPEYAVPRDALPEILQGRVHVRPGTLYVLPLESMSVADYKRIQDFESSSSPKCEISLLAVSEDDGDTSVNSCLLFCVDEQGTLRAYLQPKLFRSKLEESCLARGSQIYVVEGQNLALAVAICSDANHPDIHQLLVNAADSKAGAVIVHPQWNPTPDFPLYGTLREALLSRALGTRTLAISANWSCASSVFRDGSVAAEIETPRTQFLRGDSLRTSAGANKRNSMAGFCLQRVSHGLDRPKAELWHSTHLDEVCMWADIGRVLLTGAPAVQLTSDSMKRAKAFGRGADGKFSVEIDYRTLSSPFWFHAGEQGLGRAELSALQDATLSGLPLRFEPACVVLGMLRRERSAHNTGTLPFRAA